MANDRVEGLSVRYVGTLLAKEEGQVGRGSDGDDSKVVVAARCSRDSTVRAVLESW